MASTDRIIKNFTELATTPLRRDGLEILETGYQAIGTEKIIEALVTRTGDGLTIKEETINLGDFDRLFFVGIGKCALVAAQTIEKIVGDRLTAGLVLDRQSGELTTEKIKVLTGTHPLPSVQNMENTQAVLTMFGDLSARDLVLIVISGGGSALFSLPQNLMIEELAALEEEMMHRGVPIAETNIVRKHTSQVKGGNLAKLAYPATVYSLIFSDVPGDDMSIVASGPTVFDQTTVAGAQAVIEKYQLGKGINNLSGRLVETPKEEKYFNQVKNILALTNETALEAMRERGIGLGYNTSIISNQLQGEAQMIGAELAQSTLPAGSCRLWGGELTVTLTGVACYGGRAQEMVLAALPHLAENSLVIGAASDGSDNTPAAGALGDRELYQKAETLGLSIADNLARNCSYDFFEQTNGLIVTGPTGANVSDFYLFLTKS